MGIVTPGGHRLNWKRDLPDHRDKKYKITHPSDKVYPVKVDLRELCPPVVDQGDLGSCTANALAGALGFLQMKQLKEYPEQVDPQTGPETFLTDAFYPFSRLFIYWNERTIEGTQNQDAGASIRNGIKSLASLGACSESCWPYDQASAFCLPDADCFNEASVHKISNYHALDADLNQLKDCLVSGNPFVFGFACFASLESAWVSQTGLLQMPNKSEPPQGGHAVMCVGYDDDKKHFIVRNSWGTGWGDRGYFYMPYEYLTNPDYADDFWTIAF